ncbi:hypothetical protein AAFF_G00317940 [Aldrovandia affinis]|uniref:Uncharacterized protein n=1 Tax=Aldrovandia affinis TaxID=143900 RepID=A0AAD7R7L2_9TELE|nr:hypothetical protein AAFF_G00317940 [Aldrovandia affinis]
MNQLLKWEKQDVGCSVPYFSGITAAGACPREAARQKSSPSPHCSPPGAGSISSPLTPRARFRGSARAPSPALHTSPI